MVVGIPVDELIEGADTYPAGGAASVGVIARNAIK